MATATIRPSRAAYRKAVGANAIILLPLLAFYVFRLRDAPVAGFVALLVLLVVIGVCVVLYFRNARLDFGDGSISRTNLWGKTQSWTLSDVGTVLVVENLMAFMQAPTHNVLVLDTSGRTIIRATNQRWEPHQMRALIEATNTQPEVIEKPTDALAVRSKYPRAIPWWEAHPFATAFIAGGAFIVLFFAGYAVYTSDLSSILYQWFWNLRFRLGLI